MIIIIINYDAQLQVVTGGPIPKDLDISEDRLYTLQIRLKNTQKRFDKKI